MNTCNGDRKPSIVEREALFSGRGCEGVEEEQNVDTQLLDSLEVKMIFSFF